MTHLWEVDHPYYMNEGNYFANGWHTLFARWQDFLAEWGDADLDYNYVVRWDWKDDEDYTGDDNYRHARFLVQFVGQRKALLQSAEVQVCRNDESAIKEWLQPRFEYAKRMWEPFGKD